VAALGLLFAALSAVVANVGFLLRYRGAVEVPDVEARHPLRSALDLFRSKWWSIGYALAVVAYLLHVAALGLLALSIVQAVLAGGIVVMAVIAERFFGLELGKRQWVGLMLAAVGLAGLALTAEVRSGQESAEYSATAMLAFELALAGAGTALILSHRIDRVRSQRGVLLALSAGLLFTVTHVAVKGMSGKLDSGIETALLSPWPLIALAGGVVAFFASARSLQLGPAVPVIAVTSIAGNASAIPAGIVVFGDPLGEHEVTVIFRSLAFVIVIVAATLIPAPIRARESVRAAAHEQKPTAQARRRQPAGSTA
jgi:drug/metabolite transporter (DMT)-like permease